MKGCQKALSRDTDFIGKPTLASSVTLQATVSNS